MSGYPALGSIGAGLCSGGTASGIIVSGQIGFSHGFCSICRSLIDPLDHIRVRLCSGFMSDNCYCHKCASIQFKSANVAVNSPSAHYTPIGYPSGTIPTNMPNVHEQCQSCGHDWYAPIVIILCGSNPKPITCPNCNSHNVGLFGFPVNQPATANPIPTPVALTPSASTPVRSNPFYKD